MKNIQKYFGHFILAHLCYTLNLIRELQQINQKMQF